MKKKTNKTKRVLIIKFLNNSVNEISNKLFDYEKFNIIDAFKFYLSSKVYLMSILLAFALQNIFGYILFFIFNEI